MNEATDCEAKHFWRGFKIESVSTYFEVLDANRELFANELTYVQNSQASLASVIELYRALAADWMEVEET